MGEKVSHHSDRFSFFTINIFYMNFRLIILLAVTFCIGSQTLQAKTNNTGTVNGRILDIETKNAIDFVNVTLYKNGSVRPYLIKVTDTNGTFSFTGVAPGSYQLETKLLGFVSYKKNLEVASDAVKDLGDIILKTDSKLLNAVEVTGIRSNMKLEIDKKTYSVDQSIAAAGASASDILKDIPSIEVNAEGSISLRNSESVTVWINGKPSGLTSDNRGQVLQQLPAENIDRVEVVTNPSAKYSPEGSAGIINIILKKQKKAGYYGSLSAGAEYPWGKNLGANINYSSTKIDAYANIGLRNDMHDGKGSSKRQTYNTNEQSGVVDTSYLNSNSDRNSGGGGLFMRAGFDYHINDKHTISFSGFAMDGSHNSNSDISYNYLNNDLQPTKQLMRSSVSNAGFKSQEISMDYLWEIAEDHSLQANLTRDIHNSTSDNYYDQTDFNPAHDTINTSHQIQTGPSTGEDWEFKADYTRKFSDRWKLEAGINSEWEHRYSLNEIFNGVPSGTNWVIPTSPASSNGFDYNEQQHAIYSTLTGKMGSKFGYQLGLRGEKTIISFVSTDVTGTINKNYFDLFPTLFFNYNLSEGSEIQLNYSKRINRPRGRSINPYVDISDSTNIRKGNPNLNPEYAHSFEMNYIKTWQNHTISSSVYHRITNNVMQDIRYIENGIMYQMPSNVTNATNSGFEFVSKDKISKILETTATVNLYYSTLEGFNYKNNYYKGTNGFSWNARLNGTLILAKGLTGQISGFYTAPKIIAQGKSADSYSLDLGLRKSFFENTFQASVNARNILDSNNFDTSSWGPGFYQESSDRYFGRSFRINLTWNFGNMKPKVKPKAENSGENSMDSEGGY